MKKVVGAFLTIALSSVVTACQVTSYTYGQKSFPTASGFQEAYKADIAAWLNQVTPRQNSLIQHASVHVPSMRNFSIYGVKGAQPDPESSAVLSKFSYEMSTYTVNHAKKRNLFKSISVNEYDGRYDIGGIGDSGAVTLASIISSDGQNYWYASKENGEVYRFQFDTSIEAGFKRTEAFFDTVECVLSSDNASQCGPVALVSKPSKPGSTPQYADVTNDTLQIPYDRVEQCKKEIQDSLLDPTSFKMTSDLKFDSDRTKSNNEGHVIMTGKMLARNRGGNVAPGMAYCAFARAGNDYVLVHGFSLN